MTWISHGFTRVPHLDPPSRFPLHPIPLGFKMLLPLLDSHSLASACLFSSQRLYLSLRVWWEKMGKVWHTQAEKRNWHQRSQGYFLSWESCGIIISLYLEYNSDLCHKSFILFCPWVTPLGPWLCGSRSCSSESFYCICIEVLSKKKKKDLKLFLEINFWGKWVHKEIRHVSNIRRIRSTEIADNFNMNFVILSL